MLVLTSSTSLGKLFQTGYMFY